MKYKGIQITIAMIFLVLGFMLSIQFKSVKKIGLIADSRTRAEDLRVALSIEQGKLKDSMKAIDERDKKIEQYQNAALKNNTSIDVFKKDLERAKLLAGMNDVVGSGVIVTLIDAKAGGNTNGNNDLTYSVIHDTDIALVVNELRASGAEALSINGNRLLATSEIRCAGPVFSINNIKTSAPFVIEAIGNPDTMERSLKMTGGVVDYLEPFGIGIKIEKKSSIVVPKFNGVLDFKYARPQS
jgi:uncharacterized protein YlxW (UPF0749 family)